MTIPLLDKALHLAQGQSYWRVKLTTGQTFSEFDQASKFVPDPHTGRMVARQRAIEWKEDIVGSGDAARIAELSLVTPRGVVSLDISTPYTAFQLKRGIVEAFSGKRYMEAQIIGRVEDKETGRCTAHIWDCKHRQLVVGFQTSVQSFERWHPDIIPPGALALEVVGIRL